VIEEIRVWASGSWLQAAGFRLSASALYQLLVEINVRRYLQIVCT